MEHSIQFEGSFDFFCWKLYLPHRTEGGGGVQEPLILADVICEQPLSRCRKTFQDRTLKENQHVLNEIETEEQIAIKPLLKASKVKPHAAIQ